MPDPLSSPHPTITRELHGIDEESLLRYLVDLGGSILADGQVAGPGWSACITRLPDYHLGQVAFCSYQLEMVGEAETLREVWKRFELRILRPGG